MSHASRAVRPIVLIGGTVAAAIWGGLLTPQHGATITVTDAVARRVTFVKPPTRVAIVGRAAFYTTNLVYLYPEAFTRLGL